MATQFVGRHVRVTLSDGTGLRGLVQNVAGTQLMLSDVKFNTGMSAPTFIVNGSQIADLDLLPPEQTQAPAFVDPAIISAAPIAAAPAEDSDDSSVDAEPYTAEEAYSPKPQARGKPGQKKKKIHAKQKPTKSYQYGQDSDGWATEDITDLPDTDFDFQANLDRFDKASVFEELRVNDNIAPADRLVAFNKRAPEAKYGNQEMVIAASSPWDFKDQGVDDANARMSQLNVSKNEQKGNLKQLRKASATLDAPASKPHFLTSNTGMACPCASPVQMVELERIACETFGLSDVVLHENAGRGVAQLTVKALGGSSRFSDKNHNSRPLVVTLAGNNKAGYRALVASRHLANRQVNVVAVVPGKDGKVGNTDTIKTAIKAFEGAGGKVVSRLDQLTPLLKNYESPVELIVDGLQGYRSTFEDDWEEEIVSIALGLIEWANRQRAGTISIDVPAGLDSSTGLATGSQLYMRAKWVLSCGFPLTGLLNAHLAGVIGLNEWNNYVVDVGLPKAALHANGMRRFESVWFGGDWLLELMLAGTA